jgi:lipopolysaccharide transport system ATP-binding protein
MSAIAIWAHGLSKQYRISAGTQGHDTLRDLLSDGFRSVWRRSGVRSGQDIIWALRGASFEIRKGEIVGVIGRNGAGKSTLLKILSRIIEPTEGRAQIYGRIGSLLEVGTGFHPELSGRENIYLNGAILGMKKREIDRKFDRIVAFAETDRFIDTPVKRYSSGMHVRLAFSVAAHLEPDILLVDEVLAVGDAAFQRKCLGKMSSVAQEGRTVLFVSHNMVAVQNLCPRTILLRQGGLAFDGPTDEAVKEYLGYLDATAAQAFQDNPERQGNGRLRFAGAKIVDEKGRATESLVAGMPATFVFPYENPHGIKQAVWGMKIFNQNGAAVADFDTRYTGFVDELSGKGILTCHVPNFPLPIGHYRLFLWIGAHGQVTDSIPNACVFDVQSSVFYNSARSPSAKDCACMISHEWWHEAGQDAQVRQGTAAPTETSV